MDSNLTVHVGLPRTASTFLQERIFDHLKGIHYIGKTRSAYPDWLKEWHYASDFDFHQHRTWIRNHLDEVMVEHKPNVLSSEMFTMWGNQASTQAARLHSIAPEAKIVMVLRDPLERMRSFYKAIVGFNGFWEPMGDLIGWNETPYVFYKQKPICLGDYYYNDMIQAYQRFFPAERMLILRYEDMVASFPRFLSRLATFIGTDEDLSPFLNQLKQKENQSSSGATLLELRQQNAMRVIREAKQVLGEVWECRFGATSLPDWDLDPVTQNKVCEHLRGRCDAYYPATKEQKFMTESLTHSREPVEDVICAL